MILYMDTSALVKRYISEAGSDKVVDWMTAADFIGTSLITRVELVSALTRAIRGNRLPAQDIQEALDDFRADWFSFQHVNIDEALIERADSLASKYGLRGYDAVHLACALIWQDLLGVPISFAAFDSELIVAAQKSGLEVLSG
jgi:predicted nucleic acid-binding protein